MKNTACMRILLENKKIPANNIKREEEQRKQNNYLLTRCGKQSDKIG
jgi:hypothetical protein